MNDLLIQYLTGRLDTIISTLYFILLCAGATTVVTSIMLFFSFMDEKPSTLSLSKTWIRYGNSYTLLVIVTLLSLLGTIIIPTSKEFSILVEMQRNGRPLSADTEKYVKYLENELETQKRLTHLFIDENRSLEARLKKGGTQ